MDYLTPDWPAPTGIKAIVTTRQGGDSLPPYDSLNPALHVGDDSAHVMANRQRIARAIQSSNAPISIQWLNQTHTTRVIESSDLAIDSTRYDDYPNADACFTTQANIACAVMTADCLPVLLCRQDGTAVAAVHAGWRGLLDGIIEATVETLNSCSASPIMAWLGPAIGPQNFEVGCEVRDLFVNAAHSDDTIATQKAFISAPHDKYFADIYQLARLRLARLNIHQVYGGKLCTVADEQRFFSYRREGVSGRMASLIWIDKPTQ